MTEENRKASLFSELVIMLGTSAMQQMGKMINPMTGKAETSLEGAQASIDLLDMLDKKTKGNLDSTEERLLTDTLTSLKLTFVETKKTEAAASAKASEPAASPKTEPHAAEASGEKEPIIPPPPDNKKEDGHEPKFHKTYG